LFLVTYKFLLLSFKICTFTLHVTDRQRDRLTERQTDIETDRQTERPVNVTDAIVLSYLQVSSPVIQDLHVHAPCHRQTERQTETDRQTDRLTDRQTDRQRDL